LKSINELYNTREVSISYDVVDLLVGSAAFHHLHLLIITSSFVNLMYLKQREWLPTKFMFLVTTNISCELFCMPSIFVQCPDSKNGEKIILQVVSFYLRLIVIYMKRDNSRPKICYLCTFLKNSKKIKMKGKVGKLYEI
jgi:hypothetical protein